MNVKDLEYYKQNDAAVATAFKAGMSLEEIICWLAESRAMMIKDLTELNLIAPQAFKKPDGTVIVWHCPDHLIPVKEFSGG